MKKSHSTAGQSASELIDKTIAELGDWRGETLSRMRKLIKEADSDVEQASPIRARVNRYKTLLFQFLFSFHFQKLSDPGPSPKQ